MSLLYWAFVGNQLLHNGAASDEALSNVPTTNSDISASPLDFLRLSVRKIEATGQEPPGFCGEHLAKHGVGRALGVSGWVLELWLFWALVGCWTFVSAPQCRRKLHRNRRGFKAFDENGLCAVDLTLPSLSRSRHDVDAFAFEILLFSLAHPVSARFCNLRIVMSTALKFQSVRFVTVKRMMGILGILHPTIVHLFYKNPPAAAGARFGIWVCAKPREYSEVILWKAWQAWPFPWFVCLLSVSAF